MLKRKQEEEEERKKGAERRRRGREVWEGKRKWKFCFFGYSL